MTLADQKLARDLLRVAHSGFVEALEEFLREITPSSTLAEMMEVQQIVEERASGSSLYLRARFLYPHYWAPYLHDGRGRVAPVNARWLVWYNDPSDDPRTATGYPVRAADIQRLTREEFREGMRRNEERGYTGFGHVPPRARSFPTLPPFMLVRASSGPAEGEKWLTAQGRGDRDVRRYFRVLQREPLLMRSFRDFCLGQVRAANEGKLNLKAKASLKMRLG